MRLVERLVGCAVALLIHGSAAGQDVTPIGAFGNVRESRATGEPHCYGYSLDLWRHRERTIGLLHRHNGLCGDPPCESLVNVSHDTRTGRISFTALGVMFVGTLRRDDVIGTIEGKRVRLTRHKDDAMRMDSASNDSLDAWCRFWGGVPRCRGVDQVCRTLGPVKR
jgi:hypothetical protein